MEKKSRGEGEVGGVGGEVEGGGGRVGRRDKGARIQERDVVLMGHLALVRYLSRHQIWRLAFPGRVESVLVERVMKLERSGHLRRLGFRELGGTQQDVWALTLKGYRVAEELLGPYDRLPLHDVGQQFLAHEVGLAELYLGAVGAGAGLGPRRGQKRPTGQPAASKAIPALPSRWKWVTSDRLKLYLEVPKRQKGGAQMLQPDAVADFPHSPGGPKRVFYEWETGHNPLVMGARERATSLEGKLNRYARFFTGTEHLVAGPTWYLRAYPDAWPARVRFVVHSDTRAEAARALLEAWRAKQPSGVKAFGFEVCTLPTAVAEMRQRIGAGATPGTGAEGAPPAELDERLRPGRVSVRGEQLVKLHRLLAEVVGNYQQQGEVPAQVVDLERVFGLYAERARVALAALPEAK